MEWRWHWGLCSPKVRYDQFFLGKKMKYWQMSDLTRRNIETVAAEFTVKEGMW